MKIEIKEKELIGKAEVDGEKIEVISYTSRVELLVNGKCQDVYGNSMISGSAHITGKLTSGKEVKVAIGVKGLFKVVCWIFVNNELVFNGLTEDIEE